MKNVNDLIRQIEARNREQEHIPIQRARIRMFNPEKGYGFVILEDSQSAYLHVKHAREYGILPSELVPGAFFMVSVWDIDDRGPEVKEIRRISAEMVHKTPALPKPTIEQFVSELDSIQKVINIDDIEDQYGKKPKRKNIYPGGIENLLIEELRKNQPTDRAHLRAVIVEKGYAGGSLPSALHRVHKRGWFKEHNDKLYFKEGK